MRRFTTTPLNTTGHACVAFYYYMFGNHLESGLLSVYRQDGDSFPSSQIEYYFSKTGNQGDQWLHAEIDVSLSGVDSRVSDIDLSL